MTASNTLQALIHSVASCISKQVHEMDKARIEEWSINCLREQISEKPDVITTSLETQSLWEYRPVPSENCTMSAPHYDLYSYCDGWVQDEEPFNA